MKTVAVLIAAAAMLLSIGLRVYAASEEGRVSDDPAELQPYIETQPGVPAT